MKKAVRRHSKANLPEQIFKSIEIAGLSGGSQIKDGGKVKQTSCL